MPEDIFKNKGQYEIRDVSRSVLIGKCVGENNDAGNDWKKSLVVGTDLGHSVNYRDRTLLLFGDTFSSQDVSLNKDWRSQVIGVTHSTDLSSNLKIDGFLTDTGYNLDGMAISIMKKSDDGESSRLMSGGCVVGDSIYVFFCARNHLYNVQDANHFGGFIRSDDGGVTWHRVYSLTWVDHITGTSNPKFGRERLGGEVVGLPIERICRNANLDCDLVSDGNLSVGEEEGKINILEHEGYFFCDCTPYDGKDGYIYLFGRGGYRCYGLRLGRVRYEDFENFKAYEYMTGRKENGEPVWSDWTHIGEAVEVMENPSRVRPDGTVKAGVSNHSFAYNRYLGKWMMSYFNSPYYRIDLVFADNIWGPYGKPYVLLEGGRLNEGGFPNLYGGFLNEKWIKPDGTFYYLFSRWTKPDNSFGDPMAYSTYTASSVITAVKKS